MIKVQSLRLRGLCASSLLALAACSGSPTEVVENGSNSGADGTAMTAGSAKMAPTGQEPQSGGNQGLQDPRDRPALIAKVLESAKRNLDLRLFEDARNDAAYALELDPSSAEARDILNRCNAVLGKDTGVSARVTDIVLQDTIRRERERSQIENSLRVGDALMERGEFGRALDKFEEAKALALYSPYLQANDDLKKRVELSYQQAVERKRKAELDATERARVESQAELTRRLRDQEIAREERVESLLETANVMFMNEQYSEAIAKLDQALLLNPTHPMAISLRELADRARHNAAMSEHRDRYRENWHRTFQELKQTVIPQTDTVLFDPVRWDSVSQRRPASYDSLAAAEAPGDAEVRKRLERQAEPVRISRATVKDWATYFQERSGVTFLISQEVRDMPEDKTTLTDFAMDSRTIAETLAAIQVVTGVAYKIKDSMVHLVTPEKSIGDLYQQPYAVGELIVKINGRPGPNLRLPVAGDDSPTFQPEIEADKPSVFDETKLAELIKSTVAKERFEDSTFAVNVSQEQGTLYVVADRKSQEQVAKLLADLRRHVGIQVDVETRFLKVEDNFLEDVGIDLRGLGDQSSQGIAGRGLEKQGDRSNAGFDDFGPRQLQNPAVPGTVGTGTSPGVFFDDGRDGDAMARVENLYNQTLGGRNGGLTNSGGLALQYAFLDDTELEVVLRAVSKQERSEQIDAPRLLIYNNTRAHMLHLRQIAYIRDFEVEIAQAAAVANPVIGVVQDGVALDVRPVVDSELKFVTMEVRPTVMALQLPIPTFTTTLGVGQPISIQLPQVTRQTVRTTLTMPDGGTVMLGGMRLVERQNLKSTVPLLGNLPGLSWLFSRQGQSIQNRKILILITSRIVLMDEHEPNPLTLPSARGLTRN